MWKFPKNNKNVSLNFGDKCSWNNTQDTEDIYIYFFPFDVDGAADRLEIRHRGPFNDEAGRREELVENM